MRGKSAASRHRLYRSLVDARIRFVHAGRRDAGGARRSLVRAGKVRYVGCSNFSGWHLMKSLALAERHGWPRYVAHQAYYSLVARDYEWELMPLALDQRVGTVVWSPLAGGQLSGKFGAGPSGAGRNAGGHARACDPACARTVLRRRRRASRDRRPRLERTVPQVALNWVLQRPTVSTLVIGARNEAQLRDSLGAVDLRCRPSRCATRQGE